MPPSPDVAPFPASTMTPARVAGAVRRTLHVDVVRPDGPTGRLVVQGRARDVRTGRDGGLHELADARLDAEVDPSGRLVALTTSPTVPGRDRLLGRPARNGFRAALEEEVADLAEAHAPLHSLLDDVPVTSLISGYADLRARDDGGTYHVGSLVMADVCAGWRADGYVITELRRGGAPPLTVGAAVPETVRPDDPEGWHATPPLPPGAMRRRRRLDLVPGAAPDDPLTLDAMFRDTFVEADGVETIVHEYRLDGTLDPRTLVVLHAEAHPGVLPQPDCRGAVGSVAGIHGLPAGTLRDHVRRTYRGPTTCTHLNDLLRFLADAAGLAPHLDPPGGDA